MGRMEDNMEPNLKPGQCMVGRHMGKPAKVWRLMNSDCWAIRYFMPDGSTYGPLVCYPSEIGKMVQFPSADEVTGGLGYYPVRLMQWAQYHGALLA